MLGRLFRIFSDTLAGKPARARDSRWPAVAKAHLEQNPRCEVCDVDHDVDVHHRKPVHLYPELELDPDNLITLCRINGCHFLFGHGRDWKAYNDRVDLDVQHARAMIARRKYK